jgi:hypothetical protein
MLLLGRLAGDAAEFHRLGGEAGLAGLVYDSDPRIRSACDLARDSAHADICWCPQQANAYECAPASCLLAELHPACSL